MLFTKILIISGLVLLVIVMILYKIDSVHELDVACNINLIHNDWIDHIVLLPDYTARLTLKEDSPVPAKHILLDAKNFEDSIIKTQRYRDIKIAFYSPYLDYYTDLDTDRIEKMYAKIRKGI